MIKYCYIVLIILLHSESPSWKQSEFWDAYQLSLAPSFFLDKTVIVLTVCYYHVIYELLIELTLCTFQNAKELLAQIRDHIWSLSDSNGIQIHNHLIRKRTINHYWVITTALSCEYLSVYCIWLYVIVLSRTIFRVNLHSILAWISRNSLHKAGAISEV